MFFLIRIAFIFTFNIRQAQVHSGTFLLVSTLQYYQLAFTSLSPYRHMLTSHHRLVLQQQDQVLLVTNLVAAAGV